LIDFKANNDEELVELENKIYYLKKGFRHPVWGISKALCVIKLKLKLIPLELALAGNGGERLVIKDWQSALQSNDFVTLAHIQRYLWVQPYLEGCVCLDAGCGIGYGTHHLSSSSHLATIIGVDLSRDAIKYAQKKYKAKNLKFQQMNVAALEFARESFDAVISFDVLEHLNEADQKKFFAEVVRVLKPNGTVYIGCPNGKKTALWHPNRFHLKELLQEEFESLLKQYFQDVNLLGQDIVYKGVRQKEKINSEVSNLSISNFIVAKNDYVFGLLSVCKKPFKL
jgi:2-polyprenyl-3-methyl-5-hydroxy-6-metoxy-1,4-benzoquinol methylase